MEHMEVDMEHMMDMFFSGCSSTSSTTNLGDVNWVDWSPAIDWGCFPVDDDFNGLLEHYGLPCTPAGHDWSTNVSPASTNCPGTPVEELLPLPAAESSRDDDKGLRLVHLLMAAAEALTGANKSGDLARVILIRLRELLSRGGATNMERLAEHFTDALQRLLDGVGRHDDLPPNPGEVIEAFQLLQDMSPYVKFGHFTANQAILEAIAGQRRVHIVDYDIMEGVQWASLIQAMVSQQEILPLTPPPHLRITAVTRCGGNRRSGTSVMDTGRRLAAFAASVGLSFSFGQCRMDADDQLRPAAVKVVKGEAVVMNCALHPPHLPWRSAASVASFLGSAGELGARVVTVVEEAVACSGGDVNGGFVGSFMEEMKRYSAIWDSLEAGFPMQGAAREAVERLILGPMIAGSVSRAYRRREEGGEEREGWAEWMEEVGFGRVGLSFFNLCQSRLLLGLFNDGYRVQEEGSNKLVFCWKNCRLLSASVWSAPAMESRVVSSFSC